MLPRIRWYLEVGVAEDVLADPLGSVLLGGLARDLETLGEVGPDGAEEAAAGAGARHRTRTIS